MKPIYILFFLKGPIQQEGFQVYDDQIDILGELNNIGKKNRTLYGFYRDIKKIISKIKDGHLSFYASDTPKNFSLDFSFFVFLLIIMLKKMKHNLILV